MGVVGRRLGRNSTSRLVLGVGAGGISPADAAPAQPPRHVEQASIRALDTIARELTTADATR
jgi:hypothetical protein